MISYSKNDLDRSRRINEKIFPLFMDVEWICQLEKVNSVEDLKKVF